jgi:beta-lactamase class A
VLLLRLIVLGAGLGVLVGTGLKLLAPRLAQGAIGLPRADPQPKVLPGGGLALGRFEPRRELTGLSQQWAKLAAAQKGLTASGYLLVLDDGRYAELKPDLPLPAASSIKSPILLAALDDLDRGQLRWNEPLPLTKEVLGGGAGWMANKPMGTRFPFFEAATEMIRVSDNTATNLLICPPPCCATGCRISMAPTPPAATTWPVPSPWWTSATNSARGHGIFTARSWGLPKPTP